MFFLFLLIIIIITILLIKIEVKIVKKSVICIDINVYKINLFHKVFEKGRYKSARNKEFNISSLVSKYGIKSVTNFVYECFKIIFKLRKHLVFEKANVHVYISNKNYIKGGYYIGAIETIQYMGKNITDKFNIHYEYRYQEQDLNIGFCVIFNFRIIKILISMLKLLIIYNRFVKKGKMKNGTTSNRKLNGNCNVVD